jgi:cation diffusion facilitator CzcD-associated flavoprotein CzcO
VPRCPGFAADIIVTGLKVLLLGGMEVAVDGWPVTFSVTMNFKGLMFSDVPNLFAYSAVPTPRGRSSPI